MPYTAKGKCVYRKDTGKKIGCTKGSVKKYLAALHANVKDVNESEEFDWVKDMDPLEFIRNTFKESDMEYGQLVNGSYALSVEVPKETNYSYDEEKSIQKELRRRIGVDCYFSMARGGDDELLISITVDSKEELVKVIDWMKSDNNLHESEEFDWVPKEVDLNNHRVLYLIIEDTLKNSNFKIVKEGDVYHIEDEYGDIYFYISERDFNIPFIYHEIKDSIQFLKYEDDNEMLSYYQKLMGLLSPLYKNNIDKLFKNVAPPITPINESEEIEEFDWVKDIKLSLGFDDLKLGDVVRLKDYDNQIWEIIDIYMSDPNMTGKPSEKRIKFKTPFKNSHLELWKSPLNSNDYFELVNRNPDRVYFNVNESEDNEFDWVEDVASDGINIGDLYKINLEYPIVAKVEDIIFDDSKINSSNNNGYVVKVRYFNDNEEEEWGDYLEEINIDWMYDLINDDDHHWVKVTKEYAEKLFKDYKYFNSPVGSEDKNVNESEEWYDEILNEKPLLRFDDLKVGDIVFHEKSPSNPKFNNLSQDNIYFHIDLFKEVTTHRNGYAEKEPVAVCSLMKENPDTGNYYGISRETIPLVRGNNKPVWTLIHREGVIEESEEFNWVPKMDDVVNQEGIIKILPPIGTKVYVETLDDHSDSVVTLTGEVVDINCCGGDLDDMEYFTMKIDGGWQQEFGWPCPKPKYGDNRCWYVYPNKLDKVKILSMPKNINESEWFEDVVNEPIMLKTEELETGDIVIPTCVKEGEYIVTGKGTSVKLLDAPTHWVTLKRNTKENTGGVFIEHDTEMGRNCRFELIHRENDIIEESEEFNWVEDILSTSPLTFGGKEIMIDVSDLNYNEKVKLFDILFPHIDRDLDGANGDGDWGWDCLIKNKNVKSISLHCGIEDNEYEPQKGRVCCLSYVFGDEKEQNPESIVPIKGKDLLGLNRNQQTKMNESEEEEFNWAEDIIANTTEEIDITDNFDLWKNKLVEGSVVKITGRWEDLDFEDDIATIVNSPDTTESHLLKFDRIIYMFDDPEEGIHTHCGENKTQNIKCECQRKKNNRDEVGKCWWTSLRHMEKVIFLPFEGKQITESEEDSELFWAEDLLKGLTDSVDITDKLDIMEELPLGSILQVKGYQDEMELDMHEVKLINKAKDQGFDSTYYLFKLKHERRSDNHEMTHCGTGQKNHKICECRPATDDDDTVDSMVGKCWWIELKNQDNVIYYPNRIDLSENKIKKPLLTEGRYDAITRKVVRDIMKVVNGTRIGDFMLPWDISNEHEYEQEGLSFNLELDIVETEDIEKFEVRTAIADEDDENIMLMTIILGPKFNKQDLETLFYKLQEDVRHEIEHFTQMGPNRIEDRPIYKGNTANFKTVYGHHKNIIEVPALVRGFYRRAKIERKPIDEIMMDDLDTEIERGNLTKSAAQKLLTLWVDYAKKNLPHAIYRKD